MKNIIGFLIATTICVNCAQAESEFYPRFRRPESIIKWDKAEAEAEELALEELTRYLQKQQSLLQEEQEYHPLNLMFGYPKDDRQDDDVFGVIPPDPRYYLPIPDDSYPRNDYDVDQDEEEILEEQEKIPYRQEIPDRPVQIARLQPILVPPPQRLEQPDMYEQQTNRVPYEDLPVMRARSDEVLRQDKEALQELAHHNQAKLITQSDQPQGAAEQVYVKPVLQDDTAGVYVIAVVAGISAAATVGMIAVGIGWYK